jgi:hypothetical protein
MECRFSTRRLHGQNKLKKHRIQAFWDFAIFASRPRYFDATFAFLGSPLVSKAALCGDTFRA